MSQPRVALMVNQPQRDLAGAVLTAMELCRRGVICYLTPANLQEWEVWALAPDFVVLHNARHGNDEFARRLVQAGIRFGVVETEGGVWESCDVFAELLWSDRRLLAQARPFCAWGPVLANHLIRHQYIVSDQLCVTGCPRFDFYHDSWRRVLTEQSPDPLPGILVNTNFSMVNPRFVTAERNMQNLQSVYGWEEKRVSTYLERERYAIAAIIDLVDGLARDFSQRRIVLRPHPFENPQPYNRLLSHSNVRVNVEGPVQPQIARAAVVIQRSCTTAIESGFAGVPTLSPQWFEAPMVMPMAEDVSVPCRDYKELREYVTAILESTFEIPAAVRTAIARVTRDWFHAIDGQSHRRVADGVMRSAKDVGAVDRVLCTRYLYGLNGTPRGLEQVGRLTRFRLGLNPDWSFRHLRRVPLSRWDDTDKAFTCEDVARLVDRIECVGGPRGARLSVSLAREIGEYARGYEGHAVKLAVES